MLQSLFLVGETAAISASTQAVTEAKASLDADIEYYRQISCDGVNFGYPFGNAYTLAFSRMLHGSEVLVAYNVAGSPRSDYVVVDSTLNPPGSHKTFLYGGTGPVPVIYTPDGLTANLQLNLGPYQFAVLS